MALFLLVKRQIFFFINVKLYFKPGVTKHVNFIVFNVCSLCRVRVGRRGNRLKPPPPPDELFVFPSFVLFISVEAGAVKCPFPLFFVSYFLLPLQLRSTLTNLNVILVIEERARSWSATRLAVGVHPRSPLFIFWCRPSVIWIPKHSTWSRWPSSRFC